MGSTETQGDNNSLTQELKAITVGVDIMLGYQQYFNDYIGISYYGFVNYDHTPFRGVLGNLDQVSLGAGRNLLIDFLTTYDEEEKFKSSFGIFGGLKAIKV